MNPCCPASRTRRGRRRVRSPTVGQPPEAEVLHAFDALFDELLRARDPNAGLHLFADDPDIAMWGSLAHEQATGRDAISQHHDEITRWEATLEFDWKVRDVHVEGQAAWVNAAGTMTVNYDDGRERTAAYRLTAVFVWRDGRWRWHTFNGSEPRA